VVVGRLLDPLLELGTGISWSCIPVAFAASGTSAVCTTLAERLESRLENAQLVLRVPLAAAAQSTAAMLITSIATCGPKLCV
jgi:hypothetical protein